MSAETPLDPVLREEALTWYQKKYPSRPLAEDKILGLYQKIKTYAESDPLLIEFYRANQIKV